MRGGYLFFVATSVYLLGFLGRLLMLWQVKDSDSYFLNGSPVGILTPDAGLYGFYAKNILAGYAYPFNAEYMLGYLIAFISSGFGFSLDWVMFLLPAFMAPLAGVVLFLILAFTGRVRDGFFASLIFVFAFSYYSRTLLGFTDTDILNLFFPLGILLGVLLVFKKADLKYAIVASLFVFGYIHWYHSYAPVLYGLLIYLLLYVLVFERKNFQAYTLLLILAISSVLVSFYIQLALVLILIFIGSRLKDIKIDFRIVTVVLLLFLFAVLLLFDMEYAYSRFMDYFMKADLIRFASEYGSLHFIDTLGYVEEASKFGYLYSYKIIIGSIFMTFFGLIGYIWLCFRERLFLLLLPLLLIGAIAPVAGLRFANYAAPVIAAGLSVGIFEIFRLDIVKKYKKFQSVSYYISTAVLGVVMLWMFLFNKTYDREYLNALTLSATKKLQKIYKPNDYVVAWWDYGWPLWYFGFRNTIIDNGKHFKDNYWVSKLLISDDQNFTANTALFISEKMQEAKQKGVYQASDIILNEKDINVALKGLETEVPKTPNIGEVFIYLPDDMLLRLFNIAQFGNIDPKTAKPIVEKWRYGAYKVSQYDGKRLIGGDKNTGIFDFDIKTGKILYGGEEKQAATYTEVDRAGKVLDRKIYDKTLPYNVIKFENFLLIVGEDAFNSFAVQAIVFNNYDKERFKEIYRGENTLILQVLK